MPFPLSLTPVKNGVPGVSHSKIHMDMNALLALGDNFILFLTLQTWQLVDGFANDVQCILNLLFGDDQGWCETDDVFVCGFGL